MLNLLRQRFVARTGAVLRTVTPTQPTAVGISARRIHANPQSRHFNANSKFNYSGRCDSTNAKTKTAMFKFGLGAAAFSAAAYALARTEQKTSERELVSSKHFKSLVNLDQKEPKQIKICGKAGEKTLIIFNTDAIDGMGFCNVSALEKLSAAERDDAIDCLIQTLKQYYGGKNCFAVPVDLIPYFEKHGVGVIPMTPNGQPYGRLMAVSLAELQKRLNELSTPKNNESIKFNQDKSSLLRQAEQLSQLFIQNAEYASRSDKIAVYSAAAIAKRVDNDRVHVFAVQDKDDKPIAMMRVYVGDNNIAYASDLVVAKEYRNKGIAVALMQQAFTELHKKAGIELVSLIAGDDKEAEFYRARLGFSALTARSFTLSDNRQFMFGLFPMQELLKEYQKEFEQPINTTQLRK
jgi:ribosomal protein S18 acetylase RimI-like enzyme